MSSIIKHDFDAICKTSAMFFSCVSDLREFVFNVAVSRVTKSENFPDSKIFVAKTFRIKRVNRVNFQIRDKCALKVVLQDFG